ncbi:MAG: class I mannose-6-phosphate isomerase [Bacteroidales bacterium]|jgi:mannose-6-phosphate isomerase|nr:class I mannose-6-phosphate isomerase [Bacteroidales bacterium]
MEIYPIKFRPILKEKIWGGVRLGTLLGKPIGDSRNCGESWELSAVDGDVSIISNGALEGLSLRRAIELYGDMIVGASCVEKYGSEFPLLIKFIDAADDLSIQVHPDDEMARRKGLPNGKTEMWYVLHSEPGAMLTTGFSKRITPDDYEKMVADGTLLSALGQHKVAEGDVFFMPAGRIHAIGKGVMVAEVQQTSDTTYRVYDYGRVDSNGKGRELHVEEAKEALDFADTHSGRCHYHLTPGGAPLLVDCPYFTTRILSVAGKMHRDYTRLQTAVVLICVGGTVNIMGYTLTAGETCLIPAAAGMVDMRNAETGEAKLLEVVVK